MERQWERKISIGYDSYDNSTPENQDLPNGRKVEAKDLPEHLVKSTYMEKIAYLTKITAFFTDGKVAFLV